jgi:histidyl-tRNA synthetase
MNDILPTDEGLWRRFDDAVSDVMAGYGYGRVRTPILEHTNLFVRGIGEVTDIVEKEMYTFTDSLNGDSLTLRPENTAAVVRAVLEHNLTYDGPKRLWYSGPMFRHERPQKGRYRQFHQIGAEVLAASGPEVDAELILLCQRLWDDLALPPIRLEINCLGQSDERAAHRAALIEYFEAHADQLDADATRRLHTNPLRILDTKNPEMRALVDQAPRLADYLGDESRAHFEAVQAILKAQNLPVTVNHQLVRGLDYYNLTVFEWIAPDGLTICGGGRYDPLIEMLGGKASAGCGFAVGVERVLELMRTDMASTGGPSPDVYVIHSGEGTAALGFTAAERLRDAGMNVVLHAGGGSFKSQFKRADASGAHLAIVIGEDEAASGNLTVKHLRNRDAQQQSTGIEALPELVSNFLNEE